MKLKITIIDNSAGVILPRELPARRRLEKGDELFALETPDGIRLTTYAPPWSGRWKWPRKSCASGAPCCTNWPDRSQP